MECLDALVRRTDTVKVMCDEMVDVQLSRKHPFDKLWDLTTGLEPTKGSPLPDSASDQLEWPGRNFMSRRGYTNDTRHTPSTVGTLDGRPHHIDITGTIKRVVNTPRCHRTGNMFLDRSINALGLTQSVAPNFFAMSNFDGLTSMAMIFDAPAIFAP
eukprot:CAMPEP_0113515810 /NCGR_PEP_ID=MMETSP0014_2-20120614/41198_1 /TAXON_ID=2857 /ORGANISM="Nitzschia sp." /LENGTH=156 /DNA_ID=CAMNT_0000412513 /DNA_START=270 /DNA_END=741 /DNA_ORIENTATION=- /assembly_acc=CAM_ASM_000159